MADQETAAQTKPPKAASAFRSIGEVAKGLGVETHVIRFWETRFTQIKPVRRPDGRRYYRPEHIALLTEIRDMLHGEGLSIRGAQKRLKTRPTAQPIGGASDQAPLAEHVQADGGASIPVSSPHDVAAVDGPVGERLHALLGRLEALRRRLD